MDTPRDPTVESDVLERAFGPEIPPPAETRRTSVAFAVGPLGAETTVVVGEEHEHEVPAANVGSTAIDADNPNLEATETTNFVPDLSLFAFREAAHHLKLTKLNVNVLVAAMRAGSGSVPFTLRDLVPHEDMPSVTAPHFKALRDKLQASEQAAASLGIHFERVTNKGKLAAYQASIDASTNPRLHDAIHGTNLAEGAIGDGNDTTEQYPPIKHRPGRKTSREHEPEKMRATWNDLAPREARAGLAVFAYIAGVDGIEELDETVFIYPVGVTQALINIRREQLHTDNPEVQGRFMHVFELLQMSKAVNSKHTPGLEWKVLANCLGLDPDLFFPERGASTAEAKQVCMGCVVRGDCLEYSLRMGEKFGIWGGMSERERRQIRKERNQRKHA